MPRKPAHEQGDTLGNIERHAFYLFGRYGYEGVSIGDIAKLAKLSKGALYWHFPGKDALFLACLARVHHLFNSHIFEPMQHEPVPGLGILRLFQGIEELIGDVNLQEGIAGYWLIPSSAEASKIIAAQKVFERASVSTVRETLARGQNAGFFDLGADLEVMSRAIISIVEAVLLPLRYQTPEDVHGILLVLARTLFKAYGTEKALPLLEGYARRSPPR